MRAWEAISAWVREGNPDAPIAFRDSKGYFTIHQNNVRKWCIRLGLNRAPYWVALRHVLPDEVRALAPGLEVHDGGQFGESRIVLPTLESLASARAAVVAAYSREATRTE